MSTERCGTVVIGAGQAGLATGYFLQAQDDDFVIVDAHGSVGQAWRARWDSLRLFTPAHWAHLPGLSFPAARRHLPSKDEMAGYLASYAQRFDLPIRLGWRAEELGRECGKSLLVLDAVTDGDAARLYGRLGWERVGDIPGYALFPRGGLCGTTYFYRKLA